MIMTFVLRLTKQFSLACLPAIKIILDLKTEYKRTFNQTNYSPKPLGVMPLLARGLTTQ